MLIHLFSFDSFTDPVRPGPKIRKATVAQFCEGVSPFFFLLPLFLISVPFPLSLSTVMCASYPVTCVHTGMFESLKRRRSSSIRCGRIWKSPRWKTHRRLATNRMRWRRPPAPSSRPGSASDTSPWTMYFRYFEMNQIWNCKSSKWWK